MSYIEYKNIKKSIVEQKLWMELLLTKLVLTHI